MKTKTKDSVYDNVHQENSFHDYLDKIAFPLEFRKEDNPAYLGLRKEFIEQYRLKRKTSILDKLYEEGKDLVVLDSKNKTIMSPKKEDGVHKIITHSAEIEKTAKTVDKIFKNMEKLRLTDDPIEVAILEHEIENAIDTHDAEEETPQDESKKIDPTIPQEYQNPQHIQERFKLPLEQLQEIGPTGYVSTLKWGEWIEYFMDVKLRLIQRKILNFLGKLSPEKIWAIIDVFRGAGKTMLCIWILVMMLCQNPRLHIAYISENLKKTIQRVRLIRRILATNRKILAYYGYLFDDRPGSKGTKSGKRASTGSSFELRYRVDPNEKVLMDKIEPTLLAITWENTDALGYHFDVVVWDDPWSIKLQNQEGVLERFLEWWTEFMGCLEQCKLFLVLETRKGQDDLYAELYKMKRWAKFSKPLMITPPSRFEFIVDKVNDVITDVICSDDGVLEDSCEGKYSFSGPGSILIIRENNPLGFEREYQCNPIVPEGKIFKWKKITKYDNLSTHPLIRQMFNRPDMFENNGMFYDLGFGESQWADYNVIMVIKEYNRKFIIVDGRIGRWALQKQRLKAIDDLQELYPGYPIYIDDNYTQTSTVKELKQARPGLVITGVGHNKVGSQGSMFQQFYKGDKKAAKKGYIHDKCEHPINQGRVFISKDNPVLKEFEKEAKEFPDCKHFDCLDVLAMGIEKLDENAGAGAVGVSGTSYGIKIANTSNLRYQL